MSTSSSAPFPAWDPSLYYVGFWRRVGAALVDSALLLVVILPPLVLIYGWEYFDEDRVGFVAGPADVVISWIVPVFLTLAFWEMRQATPGKMALRARIVDEVTGAPATFRQHVLRYLGYFVSMLPLGAGLLWVAFDERKQGWHDKIAGTVVVATRR